MSCCKLFKFNFGRSLPEVVVLPVAVHCSRPSVHCMMILNVCLSHACQSYIKTLLCLYFINLTVMLCLEMSNDNVIE